MKTPQLIDIRDQITQAGIETVDLSSVISVPSTLITNRAKIPNIASDLAARHGIDRIVCAPIYEIQNELGSSGQRVWGSASDPYGLIRFVGNWSNVSNSAYGQALAGTVGSYLEVTFYGTGLNLLTVQGGSAESFTVSVNNAPATTVTVSSVSLVLGSRGYAPNQPVRMVSDLPLALYTVRVTLSSNNWNYTGIEVIGPTSSISVSPGSALSNGQRTNLALRQSIPSSSSFTNSYGSVVSPSKGGRVLVYLDSDGQVKKDIQYTDASVKNFSLADHSNEDIIRVYSPREFGSNRSDDFSRSGATPADLGFTLEDGTTSLFARGARFGSISSNPEGLDISGIIGYYVSFTFIGTGLDVKVVSDGSTRQFNSIQIDGVTISGSVSKTSNSPEIVKVVSGLPYGAHTVRMALTTAAASPAILSFITYGPKKPTLPSKAIELSDYYLLADYVQNSLASDQSIATGAIKKFNTREFSYFGTWSPSVSPIQDGSLGYTMLSQTASDSITYVFFGTGFDWRFTSNAAGASSWQITIDGSNNLSSSNNFPLFGAGWSGSITSPSATYGAGITSWTPSSGVMASSTTAISGNGVKIYNLNLGIHVVRIAKVAGAGNLALQGLDIICPIHTPKFNTPADLQNSLMIGSCSISDNRKTNYLPEVKKKNWVQSVGTVSSGITNNSTSYVPLVDMSATIQTKQGALELNFNATISLNSAGSNSALFQFYVDGIPSGPVFSLMPTPSTIHYQSQVSGSALVAVGAGVHKIDVYWAVNGAYTVTANSSFRVLTVKEI